MKVKSLMTALVNTLIIGFVGLILYLFMGHDYVKFHSGGETEILEAAARINKLCNDNGACPVTLEGWRSGSAGSLSKNNMLYYVTSGEGDKDGKKSKDPVAFRLVYRFFWPDSWFEAQGGVGKTVTSGWKNR